uniref:Uncharacterized protein n=1 Tax=Panagrellus redivivus TaxID=6233 RepID=A0A7E4VE62_PANRE
MDTVSAYPEAVRNVRPRPPSPIQEETTTDENSMTTNQTTSNVPPSHHRFRLPPLKIANTGQNGGDSAKPTVATLASPPKNMTSVGVPSKPRNSEFF